MKHEITATIEFTASHAIRLYNGQLENHHEHLWKIKAVVGSEKLDSIGIVMDFHLLNRMLMEITAPWNGKSLNQTPDFTDLNPTAENVALAVARKIKLPSDVQRVLVEVWETPENSAIYRG